MKIINIIETKEGMINQAISYPIMNDELEKDTVLQAEEKFKEMVRYLEPTIENSALDDCIENGYYWDLNDTEIDISWSEVVLPFSNKLTETMKNLASEIKRINERYGTELFKPDEAFDQMMRFKDPVNAPVNRLLDDITETLEQVVDRINAEKKSLRK